MDVLKQIKNKIMADLNLQQIVNDLNSINKYCANKDGAGLSSGSLIEYYLCDTIKKIPGFQIHNVGESDIKINDTCISLKKINGKSTIALDWSKNPTDSNKSYFNDHMMIINLKTQTWWKRSPLIPIFSDTVYTISIPSGIYLIDKEFCKQYVKLSKNNKTNTLIESEYLYMMLIHSIKNDLFIEFPIPDQHLRSVDFTNIFV